VHHRNCQSDQIAGLRSEAGLVQEIEEKPPEFCVLVALEQARVVKIPRSQLAHCFQQSISWLFR
jgi:hypothetical protein